VSVAEECYKFVHDDAKLGRFFEEDAKLVLRKQELMEKRDRLSKANAAMANIQVVWLFCLFCRRRYGVFSSFARDILAFSLTPYSPFLHVFGFLGIYSLYPKIKNM